MAHRKIELDEDANEILDSMANAYGGDANLAISELLRAHETIDTFLDDIEASQATELAAQKDRAERGFREGRFTPWREVERENALWPFSLPMDSRKFSGTCPRQSSEKPVR